MSEVPHNDVGPITYDALADLLSNLSIAGGSGDAPAGGDATQAWCNSTFVPIAVGTNVILNQETSIVIGCADSKIIFKENDPVELATYNDLGIPITHSPIATLDDITNLTTSQEAVLDMMTYDSETDTVDVNGGLSALGITVDSITLNGGTITGWDEVGGSGDGTGLTNAQTAVLNQIDFIDLELPIAEEDWTQFHLSGGNTGVVHMNLPAGTHSVMVGIAHWATPV
jgi:hypothetical protein